MIQVIKLLKKKLYFILNDVDKSAIVPQALFEEFNSVKSTLNIPIKINNNLWGVIGFAFNSGFDWQNEIISFCKYYEKNSSISLIATYKETTS